MNTTKIISVETMRELEERGNQSGLSYAAMMENAGRATALAVRNRLGSRGQCVLILVGPGNNGGDGLVAAHYLHEMGASVACYLWKRGREGDSNLERVLADGLDCFWAENDQEFARLRGLLSAADVVVDALLGIGVSRPIEGRLRDLLDLVKEQLESALEQSVLVEAIPTGIAHPKPFVVAVDCPSGLDCDTGALDPAALHADLTVTFAHAKTGLFKFPGAESVGEIVVADIGIPSHLAEDADIELATSNLVGTWLPRRPRSAHKGTFGRAMVVAGSVNYTGAASLAGAGAMRVGAGLVTMALPMPIQPSVAASLTEATYLLLPHDLGVISEGAVKILEEEIKGYDAFLVGPGLTREDATVGFVRGLLGLARREGRGQLGFVSDAGEQTAHPPDLPPLIIDADGLNALAGVSEWWKALPSGTILTPHPGEMSRLVGDSVTTKHVQANREDLARKHAALWGAVVVLKGAFTVIADPEGRCLVLPFANSSLATAGSGDVLAGAILGFRAQGLAAFEAAASGAFVHGLAGELARREVGAVGCVAGDLLPRLPKALQLLAHRQTRSIGVTPADTLLQAPD
jgi:NAD(P)H-hydrate epimerase